jgi:serpin B
MKKQIFLLGALASLIPSLFFASNSLSTSINSLSSGFYQKTLASSDRNELFSPYCLFNALSMVYVGSDGDTEEEIRQVLDLRMSQEDLPLTLKKFSNGLLSKDGRFQFNSASSVWTNQNTSLLPSYLNSIQSDFGASVTPLDFSDTKQSASTINDWVQLQTNGLLQEVIGQGDISKATQLMIVSALYFKGSWQKPFPPKLTREDLFYKTSSDVKTVSMMSQKGTFPYYENDHVQILLLPFSGKNASDGEIACFFVLPKKSLEELDAAEIPHWIRFAEDVKIQITLPRFEIHPRYDLIPMLSELGMPSAFSSNADLSKITGKSDLCIDKAIHEACFSLNELGVTAAAVTAIGVGLTCSRIEEAPAISFTANQPFIFGIVDLKSNVMLFLGKMMEP